MICGAQSDVVIEDGILKVKVEEDYVFEMLNEIKNFNIIKRALDSQDYHLELLIEKKQKFVDDSQKDIEKLKQFVGEYLVIKGE